MKAPKKYTLPRVLEIVRGHAEALGNAARELEAIDGQDPDVLALVGDRALWAAEELWEIDGCAPPGHDANLLAAWHTTGRVSRLSRSLFTIPVLVLAVEAAATDPQAELPAGRRWLWCQFQADEIAEDLMKWVKAHEKDAAQPKDGTPDQGITDEDPKVEGLTVLILDKLTPALHRSLSTPVRHSWELIREQSPVS